MENPNLITITLTPEEVTILFETLITYGEVMIDAGRYRELPLAYLTAGDKLNEANIRCI